MLMIAESAWNAVCGGFPWRRVRHPWAVDKEIVEAERGFQAQQLGCSEFSSAFL